MGSQAKLDKAFKFLNQKKYEAAAEIYLRIIKKKPQSFDAHRYLAFCYYQTKQFNESRLEYLIATSLNDKHTETLTNFGRLYLLELNDNISAKTLFEKVIALSPNQAESYHDLGNSFRQLRDYNKANEAYRKAIDLNNKQAIYYDSLSFTLSKIGDFEESMQALTKAHHLDSRLASVYTHLFYLFMMKHKTTEAFNVATNCISANIGSEYEQYELRIGVAQICWLIGDLKGLEQQLIASKNIINYSNSHPNSNNLIVFHHYLSTLLYYRKNNSECYINKNTKTLLMISESHGLSPNGTSVEYRQEQHTVISFLVTGGKMWHLTQTENNIYKESLEAFFNQLPKGCTIIMGFGEIDCRPNTGFYLNRKKTTESLSLSISKLVKSYVTNMLNSAKKHGQELIFYGIPAPHPDILKKLNNIEKEEFLTLIAQVNQQLIEICDINDTSFLDVYRLTKNNAGESNLQWHIDNIHLHPKTFATLFREYLIIPKSKKRIACSI